MPTGHNRRKPTAIKTLEGNRGRRPLNQNEPQPELIRPTCPSWLSARAKKEWERIAPQLEKIGLLTEIDRAPLAGYCDAYAEWAEAGELIEQEGMMCMDSRGAPKTHPAVVIRRHARDQLRHFSTLFGMNPSDRAGMELPASADDTFALALDDRMRLKRG